VGGRVRLAAALRSELGRRALGNDVDVATDAEFELGAGKPYDSLLGVFWGTGVGGGVSSTASRGSARRRRRDRPHGRQGSAARVPVRAPRLHGGLRRPRRDGGPRAPARRRASKTDLFKIMEERGRDRLTSGIWERALAATTSWRSSCSTARSRRSAPASPRRSTCSTSRRCHRRRLGVG
jgi:glucokinase